MPKPEPPRRPSAPAPSAVSCALLSKHLSGAFEGLEQVGRAVLIDRLDQLANISGFGRLNRVGHSPNLGNHVAGVIIQQNDMLTDLDAFHNVSDFTGIFSVHGNPSLERINVFAGATRTVFSRHPGFEGQQNPVVEHHAGHASIYRANCVLKPSTSVYTRCTSPSALSGTSIQISANPSLTTIAGLGSLTEMSGSILIHANDNLQGIPACESLTRSNGSVIIQDNPALTELGGFTALVEVNGSVIVENNTALALIAEAAYGSLATVGGDVVLRSCTALSLVPGFSSLERVGGSLVLDELGLSSVWGDSDMPRLQEVGKVVLVANMSSLSTLVGPTISGLPRVAIVANPALVTIDGFSAAQTMGGDPPRYCDAVGMGSYGQGRSWPEVRAPYGPDGSPGVAPTGALSVVGNAALTSIGGFASVTAISVPGPSFACGRDGQASSTSPETLPSPANCTSALTTAMFHDAMPFWAMRNQYAETSERCRRSRYSGLDGFTNARQYSPAILIDGNDQLASIGALPSLLRVDGDVAITNNANLRTLDAFAALQLINGSLSIAHNDVLADISGFSSLEEVHGHFRLIDSSNSSEPNGPGWTAGFGSLRKVYGTLTFAGNVTSFSDVFPNLECAGHVQCGVLRQLGDRDRVAFITPYFNSSLRTTYYGNGFAIPRGHRFGGQSACPAAWQSLPACE